LALDSAFRGDFSSYILQRQDIELAARQKSQLSPQTRTDSAIIWYDEQNADESWREFLDRVDALTRGWNVDAE
jgi:hypothetical protein